LVVAGFALVDDDDAGGCGGGFIVVGGYGGGFIVVASGCGCGCGTSRDLTAAISLHGRAAQTLSPREPELNGEFNVRQDMTRLHLVCKPRAISSCSWPHFHNKKG
jgi:hypothetical protein